ncbi:MAG TPA: hypothetical protein VKH40_10315 [Alloacidobacterium sp.]|nr:hypothetical protein [Alloacidobacterium sp.]
MILATRQDETAAWLANRWQPHGAVVVSAADLSMSGWSLDLCSPAKSSACIGGRKVTNQNIDGVLTRMPCVHEQELNHIVPLDRQYVASEMTAFLLAWLSSLACPVLNRPTPDSLGGPGWRREGWVHLANRLGIPVAAVRRNAANRKNDAEDQTTCEVIVVGDQCFGEAAPPLIENARMLAKAAGTGLLTVHFSGAAADSVFVSASPWPNLASPMIADAVLRCLHGRSAC